MYKVFMKRYIMVLSNTTFSTTYSAATLNDNVKYETWHGESAYINDNSNDDSEKFIYPVFSFEKPVYLYIWEILVIVVFLVNIIVIMVLLRKKMRNATNMILAAIAFSDSLSGLVTLPSYMMMYMEYDPIPKPSGDPGHYTYDDYFDSLNYTYYDNNQSELGDNFTSDYYDENNEVQMDEHEDLIALSNGYSVKKNFCIGFMISKFFLSKSFHTVSIFLTLFLGIQRYVSVAYPFRSKSLFSDKKTTLICCAVIFAVSPVLHAYQIGINYTENGLCVWEHAEDGCGSGCIYQWFTFFLRHLIPCVTLLVFTGLFIRQLHLGERNLRRMDSTLSQVSRRVVENRRITIVVTSIVIAFLVPEIPYGIFLLYTAIHKTIDNGKGIKLKTDRAVHMSYELLLVMSFHANFYIYTILNRRFRKCLYRTFIKPVQRYVGNARRLSVVSRSSSNSFKTSTRRTEFSSKNGQELNFIQRKSSERSGTLDTKVMESFSSDLIQPRARHDVYELEHLNANV